MVYFLLIHFFWIGAGVFLGIVAIWNFCYAKHIKPTIWSIAANIATGVVFTWTFFVLDMSFWWKILISILFSPIFILANRSLKHDVKQDMHRRSRRSSQIIEQVLSGNMDNIPKFGLFLRPFISTDHLPAQTFPSLGQRFPRHLDLETVFKRVFDQELDIIALGRPEDISEGISRVTIQDKGWQDVVRQLMDKALFILVVPLIREGTLWELKELKVTKHLGKTIFIMPEMMRDQPQGIIVPSDMSVAWEGMDIGYYNSEEHYIDFSSEWERARQILEKEELEIPLYSPTGALFTLSPDTGLIRKVAPLPISLLIFYERYIWNVFTYFELLPLNSKFNNDIIHVLEESTFPVKKNRKYVLTLAYDLYDTIGDYKRASIILQRINDI